MRWKLINHGDPFISGPDDLIPRSPGNGDCAFQPSEPMTEKYLRNWDDTPYGKRVRDAAAMLKRGCCQSQVREIHGLVVLRQALAILPRTDAASAPPRQAEPRTSRTG